MTSVLIVSLRLFRLARHCDEVFKNSTDSFLTNFITRDSVLVKSRV